MVAIQVRDKYLYKMSYILLYTHNMVAIQVWDKCLYTLCYILLYTSIYYYTLITWLRFRCGTSTYIHCVIYLLYTIIYYYTRLYNHNMVAIQVRDKYLYTMCYILLYTILYNYILFYTIIYYYTLITWLRFRCGTSTYKQ
jgi:hypothetical protein